MSQETKDFLEKAGGGTLGTTISDHVTHTNTISVDNKNDLFSLTAVSDPSVPARDNPETCNATTDSKVYIVSNTNDAHLMLNTPKQLEFATGIDLEGLESVHDSSSVVSTNVMVTNEHGVSVVSEMGVGQGMSVSGAKRSRSVRASGTDESDDGDEFYDAVTSPQEKFASFEVGGNLSTKSSNGEKVETLDSNARHESFQEPCTVKVQGITKPESISEVICMDILTGPETETESIFDHEKKVEGASASMDLTSVSLMNETITVHDKTEGSTLKMCDVEVNEETGKKKEKDEMSCSAEQREEYNSLNTVIQRVVDDHNDEQNKLFQDMKFTGKIDDSKLKIELEQDDENVNEHLLIEEGKVPQLLKGDENVKEEGPGVPSEELKGDKKIKAFSEESKDNDLAFVLKEKTQEEEGRAASPSEPEEEKSSVILSENVNLLGVEEDLPSKHFSMSETKVDPDKEQKSKEDCEGTTWPDGNSKQHEACDKPETGREDFSFKMPDEGEPDQESKELGKILSSEALNSDEGDRVPMEKITLKEKGDFLFSEELKNCDSALALKEKVFKKSKEEAVSSKECAKETVSTMENKMNINEKGEAVPPVEFTSAEAGVMCCKELNLKENPSHVPSTKIKENEFKRDFENQENLNEEDGERVSPANTSFNLEREGPEVGEDEEGSNEQPIDIKSQYDAEINYNNPLGESTCIKADLSSFGDEKIKTDIEAGSEGISKPGPIGSLCSVSESISEGEMSNVYDFDDIDEGLDLDENSVIGEAAEEKISSNVGRSLAEVKEGVELITENSSLESKTGNKKCKEKAGLKKVSMEESKRYSFFRGKKVSQERDRASDKVETKKGKSKLDQKYEEKLSGSSVSVDTLTEPFAEDCKATPSQTSSYSSLEPDDLEGALDKQMTEKMHKKSKKSSFFKKVFK